MSVFVVGTFDSKGEELDFVVSFVKQHGLAAVPVDVGVSDTPAARPNDPSFVSRCAVLEAHTVRGGGTAASGGLAGARGDRLAEMAQALTTLLVDEAAQGHVAGVIGVGGSCGSALVAPALQALPIGLPKLLVSTMASGNVAPYVGCSDVTIMNAVTDVAGLNSISRIILSNAAAAVCGMATAYKMRLRVQSPGDVPKKPTVALSMFGVTTPCCTALRQLLEPNFECVTFHAVGSGGRALEKLVASGTVQGVIDVTTTEIADEVCGGVLSAGPDRLSALAHSKLPYVVSLGALDMVNFGALSSVPTKYASRLLCEHNSSITLMRTNVNENKRIAEFIAQKLAAATTPVTVVIPEKGLSLLSAEGGRFHDADADTALFDSLTAHLASSPHVNVVRVAATINDTACVQALYSNFMALYAAHARERAATATAAAAACSRAPTSCTPAPVPFSAGAVLSPRQAILQRLHCEVASGRPIIGAGAGTGISAKFEEAGGCDLIIVYNSGRFRMAGRGSLAGLMPYKDANKLVIELAGEVLPVVRAVPVLAGVCATDPFRCMRRFLRKLKKLGYAGVQNFPTVGLIDGTFRVNLEETGITYQKEVEMIQLAHSLDLLTSPYVFSPEDARAMAAAGADIIVAHMGLTSSGSIGASTVCSLGECVSRVQNIRDAAVEVNPHVVVLCHGGPIATPQDAAFVLHRTSGVHGFYGASSMERLPCETAITAQAQAFKSISWQ